MRTKIFNRMASKALRLARGTALALGAAVILAVVFGVATTALAGTGVGATFNLGKANAVNALSSLVGSTAGSMLKVDNNGSGAALDLRVGPSTTPPADKTVAPMRVDSQARVANFNADEIDGMDSSQFMTASTYSSESPKTSGTDIGNGTGIRSASWACDPGDELLSGGYRWKVNATSVAVVGSYPWYGVTDATANEWVVEWANTANPDQPYQMQIYIKCADTAAPAHG